MSDSDSSNDDCIHLSWCGSSCAWDRADPDQYLQETEGEIRRFDEDDNEVVVGKFRLYYVDVDRATEAGLALFDVLDSDSATIDYFKPLFGSDAPEFRDRVMRLVSPAEVLAANLLIVDRVEILPSFRGRSLGHAAMREMIARFGMGAAIVAMKPFPLQFEVVSPSASDPWRRSMELEMFSQDMRSATAKLVTHYRKLGFTLLSRTPLMVRSTYLGALPRR